MWLFSAKHFSDIVLTWDVIICGSLFYDVHLFSRLTILEGALRHKIITELVWQSCLSIPSRLGCLNCCTSYDYNGFVAIVHSLILYFLLYLYFCTLYQHFSIIEALFMHWSHGLLLEHGKLLGWLYIQSIANNLLIYVSDALPTLGMLLKVMAKAEPPSINMTSFLMCTLTLSYFSNGLFLFTTTQTCSFRI